MMGSAEIQDEFDELKYEIDRLKEQEVNLRELLLTMNYKMVELQEEYNKLLRKTQNRSEDRIWVKNIRIKLGFNQTNFAKKIGISQTHVSDLETGRKTLTGAVVGKIQALKEGE